MKLNNIKGYISNNIDYICLCTFALNAAVIFLVLIDRYLYEKINFSLLSLIGNAPRVGPGKIRLFLFLTLLSLIVTIVLYKFFCDKKQNRCKTVGFLILYMFQFSLISIIDYTVILNEEIILLKQEQSKVISESEHKMMNHRIDLIIIRQLVEKEDPNVKYIKSDLELAIYLRDYVYRNIIHKDTAPGFDFSDFLRSYKLSFNNPEQGHICGGLAIEYQMLLEAFGIQSRYVGLFTDSSYPYESHATVEVYISGKWIASDPNYNVMFKKDDLYLGYLEIRDILLKGGSYEVETNGMQIDPGRRIEENYVSMKELIKYMVIYLSYTIRDGVEKQYDYIVLPKEWDGKVIGGDGKSFDMLNFNENNIQYILSNGILR